MEAEKLLIQIKSLKTQFLKLLNILRILTLA